jgi:hypothetical protein
MHGASLALHRAARSQKHAIYRQSAVKIAKATSLGTMISDEEHCTSATSSRTRAPSFRSTPRSK